MADFIVPLKKAVQELVAPALYELTWRFGTPKTSARATVVLRAKDEAGEWSNDYAPFSTELTDSARMGIDGGIEFPEPRVAFHAAGLMLDAVIPADDPRAVALGVGGLTVREMGELLIQKRMTGEI